MPGMEDALLLPGPSDRGDATTLKGNLRLHSGEERPADAQSTEARRPCSHVGRVTKEDENNGGKYPGNREALDHLEFYSNRQGRIRT